MFHPEPEYLAPVETVGDLTRAHVANTMALRRANMKLKTICLALDLEHGVCSGTD